MKSVKEEMSFDVDESMVVQGAVPTNIAGTLYTNGPGLFEFGRNKVESRVDGDGIVCGFTFAGDGSCKARSRFVRTEGYLKEQKALELGYEGEAVFKSRAGKGTVLGQAAGFNQIDDVKATANSGVFFGSGRLLAVDDCFLPHEIDPAGLYTVGATRIRDSLPKRGPLLVPKYDPAEKRVIGMSSKTLVRPSYVTRTWFLEWDQEWRQKHLAKDNVPEYRRLTDFGFTRTDYVVMEAPMKVNWVTFAAGGKSVREICELDTQGKTKISLIPRKGDGEAVVFEGECDVPEKIVNAYTDRDSGMVIVDTICYDSLPTVGEWDDSNIPSSRMVRWTLDPSDPSQPASKRDLSAASLDYPTINPYVRSVRHSHTFSLLRVGGSPKGLHTINTGDDSQSEWRCGEGDFCSPPVFLPKADGQSEDDGYLATMIYSSGADATDIALLDATSLEEGPICRIRLPTPLPHGHLGCWAEGYVPSSKDYAEGRRKALWSDKGWEAFDASLPFL